MFTITIEQVNRDKAYSLEKLQGKIKDYVTEANLRQIPKRKRQTVQYLLVLNSILQDWEQGDFTDAEYINYLTGKGYLNLIEKIRNV